MREVTYDDLRGFGVPYSRKHLTKMVKAAISPSLSHCRRIVSRGLRTRSLLGSRREPMERARLPSCHSRVGKSAGPKPRRTATTAAARSRACAVRCRRP